jgi:hypothetical protein
MAVRLFYINIPTANLVIESGLRFPTGIFLPATTYRSMLCHIASCVHVLGAWDSTPVVKRLEREAHRSSLSGSEVKNAWIFTSAALKQKIRIKCAQIKIHALIVGVQARRYFYHRCVSH